MSKPDTSKKSPSMNSITPHIVCKQALDAIEYYKKAFNATEELRLVGPDGQLVHGALRIGEAVLMLTEECPQWGSAGPLTLKGSPVTLHLVVPDVDATVAQAVEAGATVTMPVSDMFWGDRYGQIQDPFGHRWSIATPIRTLSPAELQAAMTEAFAHAPA